MTKTTETAIAALALDVERPGRMTILHPSTGMPLTDMDGKEAYVELLSGDSDAAEKIRKALRAARLRTRNPNKVDMDREHVELLAALSTDWYLVDFAGNLIELPFSAANATELYASNRMRWLTDQVDEYAGDRGNFLQASSRS